MGLICKCLQILFSITWCLEIIRVKKGKGIISNLSDVATWISNNFLIF